MWVSYQAANGHVSLLLNATDGKFNGVKYIQEMVEDIGEIKIAKSSTLLDNNLEIEYKNGKLAGASISMVEPTDCVYDTKWNHFNNTNYKTSSYECYYRWDKKHTINGKEKTAAEYIKIQLEKEANENDGKVTIGKACEILTNSDNWN